MTERSTASGATYPETEQASASLEDMLPKDIDALDRGPLDRDLGDSAVSPGERLRDIAQDLHDEKTINSPTVREFLSWFGAQRRGYYIVERIRQSLSEVKLQTEPDFESAYIDSSIRFVLAPESPHEDATPPQTEAITGSASGTASLTDTLTVTASPADPTYRISKLAAANKQPVFIRPDAELKEAVTLMLSHDFSQLPVMTSERDVKGVVSWVSIGTHLALGRNGDHVREMMDTPQITGADGSLFDAIRIIVDHQYVLVQGSDRRITGIITASDLSLQFRELAEPFLRLGEIENHLRHILRQKYSLEDFVDARDPADSNRKVAGVTDLTFGEYIRLLENPDKWAKLSIAIDRAVFCDQLKRVRDIRNDVMHFDPDGIPPDDLQRLRDFTRFLQRLQDVGVP